MTRPMRDGDFVAESDLSAGAVFTYSRASQPWFRRGLIRLVEALSGRNHFERTYRAWQRVPRAKGVSVFSSAIQTLGVRVEGEGLGNIPVEGGLVVIANHPFGILDGLAVGDVVSRVRPDVKLMVHSLLCQPTEARDLLLPVDFGTGPEARRTSAETRRHAIEWLDAGHVLVIFPAGSVSTAPKPFAKAAVDCEWHPFVARLAGRKGVRVQPLFIEGQNSRLFQVISHLSYPLRVALIFHETRRQMARGIRITAGPVVAVQAWPKETVVPELRAMTYGLGGQKTPGTFVWPKHIRF